MKMVLLFAGSFFATTFFAAAAGADALYEVGVAKIDITPDYPVRLSGYGNRRAESEGVKQHIFAKALAIGSDRENPALLITIDNCGVSEAINDEVRRRLAGRANIKPERVAVSFSHTHSAPMLKGVLPFLFGIDIPPEHQEHIDRYTRELIDKLEQVSLAALKDRRPAKLSWGRGQADFAKNRRPQNGPSDHDLPVLEVADKAGKIRAVLVSYACHCTTVTGEFNHICGDWAGYAQEYLERDHPGAIVLTAIGCGADQNPFPRPGFELAQQHGAEIEKSVNEVLARTLTPIQGKLFCKTKRIALPFATLPTRAEWDELAKKPGAIGYHAQKNIARLERGEKLPTELPYTVQVWNFGDDLAMVFLPGEVVVDYSLRLKKEFDSTRLWVNAYANDAPCYIPSKRVLTEGGYEGGGAMVYYDRPTKFAEPIEELIVGAVHDLVPKTFLLDASRAEFPPPKSPPDALAAFRSRNDFVVELVAAEPLVVDPVAIDFGADGKLWVVEMRDYPAGMDGKYAPGGRVKILESTTRDGHFDKATVFLEGLPFPTGVMAWKKGALICAAPDILYAEDTDGDGKADVVQKLFSGFATHNFQARVNCLRWGLDGWIYGAAGLFGGTIHGQTLGRDVELTGRDFRLRPESGEFEPVNGLSQQGRVRDDFGRWFGCDNSTLLWQFPLPDFYLRRNPWVTAPAPRVLVPRGADINHLYPASRTLERFNQPDSANRTTSACGLEIYRDDFLGRDFRGNAFVCEPVHNLVHREVLNSDGIIFSGHRAPEESHSEFLASTDNWFRPVEARTGPDGALWVVDMYRFVIEHPRWIPPERLAKLNPRAGDDRGRIYKIFPRDKKLRATPNLQKLSRAELVAAFDTPNGPERDLIHREILLRDNQGMVSALERTARHSALAPARAQALWALDELKSLSPELLRHFLDDSNGDVVSAAIQLAENHPEIAGAVAQKVLTAPTNVAPLFQAALSAGNSTDPRSINLLGEIATTHGDDPWIRAAVLSSAANCAPPLLKSAVQTETRTAGRAEIIDQLVATASRSADANSLQGVLDLILPRPDETIAPWHFSALAMFLQSTRSQRQGPADSPEMQKRIDRVKRAAGEIVGDEKKESATREAALRLAGSDPSAVSRIVEIARTTPSSTMQKAALAVLKNSRSAETSRLLLKDWTKAAPAFRAVVVDILMARQEWMNDLLEAIEQQTVIPGEISIANRQRLLQHPNATIQRRASMLFAGRNQESRTRILEQYAAVPALKGDAKNGALVFEKNCATCHALRGVGHAVGPDLAGWRDKSVQDFLVAILDPSAAIEPRFINYQIETVDGRSLSGIIEGETATIVTLAQPGGVTEKLLRSQIAEIRALPLSLMPEGLEQAMTPQELADLIAWFKN